MVLVGRNGVVVGTMESLLNVILVDVDDKKPVALMVVVAGIVVAGIEGGVVEPPEDSTHSQRPLACPMALGVVVMALVVDVVEVVEVVEVGGVVGGGAGVGGVVAVDTKGRRHHHSPGSFRKRFLISFYRSFELENPAHQQLGPGTRKLAQGHL